MVHGGGHHHHHHGGGGGGGGDEGGGHHGRGHHGGGFGGGGGGFGGVGAGSLYGGGGGSLFGGGGSRHHDNRRHRHYHHRHHHDHHAPQVNNIVVTSYSPNPNIGSLGTPWRSSSPSSPSYQPVGEVDTTYSTNRYVGSFGDPRHSYQRSVGVSGNNGDGGAVVVGSNYKRASESDTDSDCSCFAPNGCGFLVVLPLLIVFVLTMATSGNERKWVLNSGEARVISPQGGTMLNRKVTVQSVSSAASRVSTSVYYIANGQCPPLVKDDSLSTEDHNQVALQPGDYEYDYYYLLAGSTVDVTAYPSAGTMRVYLFRGSHSFHQWEEDADPSRAIMSAFASAASNRPAHLSYTTQRRLEFGNTYYAVYDNVGYTQEARLETKIRLERSTFDTTDLYARCTTPRSSSSMYCDVVLQDWNPCFFVKVAPLPSSSSPSSKDGNTTSTVDQVSYQDEEVTVTISCHRRWLLFALLASIPIWVSLAVARFSDDASSSTRTADERTSTSENYEFEQRPPPQAPGWSASYQAVPSAPPAEASTNPVPVAVAVPVAKE